MNCCMSNIATVNDCYDKLYKEVKAEMVSRIQKKIDLFKPLCDEDILFIKLDLDKQELIDLIMIYNRGVLNENYVLKDHIPDINLKKPQRCK